MLERPGPLREQTCSRAEQNQASPGKGGMVDRLCYDYQSPLEGGWSMPGAVYSHIHIYPFTDFLELGEPPSI